jgi:phenylalanyl-tRNA synthetase beta chain
LTAEALPPTHWGSRDAFHDLLARVMLGMGLDEVFNFTLVDEELVRALLEAEPIKIVNPRMKSYSAARPSLIPSLLLAVRNNQEHQSKVEIFEIGPVVLPEGTEWRLGVAVSKDKATLTDVGAVLMGLKEVFGLDVELVKHEQKPFIKGRCAKVLIEGEEAGVIGEVHPEYLSALGIKRPVAVLEVKTESLR